MLVLDQLKKGCQCDRTHIETCSARANAIQIEMTENGNRFWIGSPQLTTVLSRAITSKEDTPAQDSG